MRVVIEAFGPRHEAAAAAFNRRMRQAGADTAFLLPTRAAAPAADAAVTLTQYVAVDEGGEVRGGILCQEHPAKAGSAVVPTVNLQAPLSEGIVDRTYAFVGTQLVKHATRRVPHAFVVGMGNAALPFPRLLKAMGWNLYTSPFYFRMLDASRCVRQLSPFRATRTRQIAARLAAFTGAAAIAGRIVHREAADASRAASEFEVSRVTAWDATTDAVWERFAGGVSFGVQRTADVLRTFYPANGRGPQAWMLRRHGAVEGWFGLIVTEMRDNAYFGDLTVATLTDCIGTPAALRAGMALAAERARAQGADIVITNQQHRGLRESCRAAGWLEGPSNYLIAVSPALRETFDDATAYITRRDGDGLTNLSARREDAGWQADGERRPAERHASETGTPRGEATPHHMRGAL